MLWWFWGAANKIIMISILLKLLFLHEFGERKYRQKLEASAVTTIGDSMMKKALQLDPLTEEIWKLIDPDRRKACTVSCLWTGLSIIANLGLATARVRQCQTIRPAKGPAAKIG